MLDPSRVAAQIVSGIGFLGAGLIITRRGAIRGLTTAAAVWETAAIGMAAGAGLPLLAVVVTGLHFVIVLGYTALNPRLPGASRAVAGFTISYEDGRGVLRRLLAARSARDWAVTSLAVDRTPEELDVRLDGGSRRDHLVTVNVELAGSGAPRAAGALGSVDGVVRVARHDEDDED